MPHTTFLLSIGDEVPGLSGRQPSYWRQKHMFSHAHAKTCPPVSECVGFSHDADSTDAEGISLGRSPGARVNGNLAPPPGLATLTMAARQGISPNAKYRASKICLASFTLDLSWEVCGAAFQGLWSPWMHSGLHPSRSCVPQCQQVEDCHEQNIKTHDAQEGQNGEI